MKMVWAGRVVSVVVALPFVFSAAMKLMMHPEVIKGMSHLGLPESLIRPLGVLELLCVVVYLVPKTSIFGAILFTGYVGGAMLAHLRIGEPVYLHIAMGILIWLGLYLRRPQLRELLWAPGAAPLGGSTERP
jgi:DoxX-like protein